MERRLFFEANCTQRKPRKYCMRSYLSGASGASGAIGARLSGLAAFATHAIPCVYIFLNMNTSVCRLSSKMAVHLCSPNVCVRVCAHVCVLVCLYACFYKLHESSSSDTGSIYTNKPI